MRAIIRYNFENLFYKNLLTKNINIGFNNMVNYKTNFLLRNDIFSFNTMKKPEENQITNTNIHFLYKVNTTNEKDNEIFEQIKLKNKTRKVAERKRKKRKTGKDIRIRWR